MHCLAAIQMYHEFDDSKSPVSSEFIFMGIGKALPDILWQTCISNVFTDVSSYGHV